MINTWEAVYFDQDLDRLVGARRGRRGGRRGAIRAGRRLVLGIAGTTHAGLGDWYVDDTVWPDGLGPADRQGARLGMQFGLWVEPEMINLDSDLARAHPEWIFRAGGRTGIATRQQYVLDLGHPEAYDAHRRAAARPAGCTTTSAT